MTRVALLCLALAACKDSPREPTVEEITERGWAAHELVVAAGEAQPTCAGAGAAMQKVFVANRQAFVDAIALDRDKARLEQATTYIEAHQARYLGLEERMEKLQDRCAQDATVQAAFAQMGNP
ncbi:MAG: hypothetical protein JNL83_25530 [Myxococcales bacterium]|nr:hypothetical protein [Myxococcales bacterium]